jgi:hypothetical protein
LGCAPAAGVWWEGETSVEPWLVGGRRRRRGGDKEGRKKGKISLAGSARVAVGSPGGLCPTAAMRANFATRIVNVEECGWPWIRLCCSW